VLVLAGLDPSGGAGVFADAEAVRAMGARPLCVPTALTVQTTRTARKLYPVGPSFLLEAARALLEEEDVRAIKLGMLGTPQMALAVLDLLVEVHARVPGLPVVLDPVLAASSGAPLFKGSPDEARAAVSRLLSHVVITPNALEAQVLLDLDGPVQDLPGLTRAALLLTGRGARAALVKGGHAQGAECVDVLAVGATTTLLGSPRLERGARGTGCRLASALAARLALGDELVEAARAAKGFVTGYLTTPLVP
jgi:hydroxymethylpyrimidine/phosphomethylpyrimidine kinase